MAFFQDIGKKITQTGQDAVQKTKDIADTVKFNNQIAEEEKRITALYTQIGEVYYTQFGGSPDPALADAVGEISAARARIYEYSEQIKLLKGVTKCPSCGADVPNGTAFCSGCGAATAPAPQAAQGAACTGCGAPMGEGVAFCTNCGTKRA